MKKYIFVYGTLKRNKGANHFLSNAKFIGEGVIQGYEMYIVGYFPGIVKGKGKIRGEVYEVDEEILEMLDEYEGVPDLYERIRENVKLDNGKELEAYFYLYKGDVSSFEEAPINSIGEYEF